MRLNTTMDRDSLFTPEVKKIIDNLESLMKELHERELKYSNWFGRFKWNPNTDERVNRGPHYQPYPNAYDDDALPWFRYWEYAQMLLGSGILDEEKPVKCLDMGGSSTIFTFLLASLGHIVYTVDLRPNLVSNARHVADEMGWNMINRVLNLINVENLNESFDYIYSICVMEHLRQRPRRRAMRKIRGILNSNGVLGLTFDYLNPKPSVGINTPNDVQRQFVKTGGLKIRGPRFMDNGKRYLYHMEQLYTFGSLLLEK